MAAQVKGSTMRIRVLLLAGLLLCLIINHPAQAQKKRSPLLMLIGNNDYGDLWSWSGENQPLKQLTNWHYNLFPALSPDSKYIAYASVPQFAIPPDCSGWPPFNIWLLEVSTGNATRIADQPSKASYCGNTGDSTFIRRPRPAWSPDSKFLAWGESYIYPEMPKNGRIPYRLVVYNVAKRSQRIIVDDLPGEQQITNGQAVDWGEGGITYAAVSAAVEPLKTTVYIYDADGKQLFTKVIPESGSCLLDGVASRWVKNGAGMVLAVCIDYQPVLIDPVTGKQSELAGAFELYNPELPNALSLVATAAENRAIQWHVVTPGQPDHELDALSTAMYLTAEALNSAVISPDGQQVAYVGKDGLYVYDRSGEINKIAVTLEKKQQVLWLGWGHNVWRIH
jgi:hypothetical protein